MWNYKIAMVTSLLNQSQDGVEIQDNDDQWRSYKIKRSGRKFKYAKEHN